MRNGPRTFTALAALLWAAQVASAQGEDTADRYDKLQEKLSVERAALATLRDQQASVLEVIDLLDQRARATVRRARLLERDLGALRVRGELARRQQQAAGALLEAQLSQLTPRLRAMYRLKRRQGLEVLLCSRDLTTLVKTSRALSTLLQRDLALLEQTVASVRLHQQSQRRLERLEGWVLARAEQLERERELAAGQQQLLASLLERIGADAKQRALVVRELVQAERRLSRLLDDFGEASDESGFASQKGHLPWPTAGIIEVGFGKVLNPRFNTVTFQKGLDIRARKGLPVVAVADGKVAWAGWLKGYGNLIILDHGGGHHSLMGHLDGFSVEVGDLVEQAQEVGQVGDSGSLKGAYLYFEVRKNGVAVDPTAWLGAGGM
jgi:murein hydrolase activator